MRKWDGKRLEKYIFHILRRWSYKQHGPFLDGNSEHVAHPYRKIGLSGEQILKSNCSLSKQMPDIDEITEIAPYLRTYF